MFISNIIQSRKRKLAQNHMYKNWKLADAKEKAEFTALLSQLPHITALKKVEGRQFYDSTWEVELLTKNSMHIIHIVRNDMQKRLPLLKLLADAKTPEAVKALDERTLIPYN